MTLSFVGPCAVRTIESHLADMAFFSVKEVPAEGHLTDANPQEAEVKRAMIRQAERPVLLVDGRKFERRGLSVVAHVSEVSLVMAADTHPSHAERLAESGVDVRSVWGVARFGDGGRGGKGLRRSWLRRERGAPDRTTDRQGASSGVGRRLRPWLPT